MSKEMNRVYSDEPFKYSTTAKEDKQTHIDWQDGPPPEGFRGKVLYEPEGEDGTCYVTVLRTGRYTESGIKRHAVIEWE